MTSGLLTSSLFKNKLYRIKLNKPNSTNISRYKDYCSVYNKLKRKAKKMYYHEKLTLYKHDMRKTWSTLNEIIKRSTKKHSLPLSFIVNGRETSNGKDIANEFNDLFVNIGKSINDILGGSLSRFHNYLNSPTPTIFSIVLCFRAI